jgi:hypothetical protein
VIRNLILAAAAIALAACTPNSPPTTIDTTCQTQKPICWRGSWPDDAIVQAKTHNAKLFALCPEIKARIKVICAQVGAETDLVLKGLPKPGPAPMSVPAAKQVPP